MGVSHMWMRIGSQISGVTNGPCTLTCTAQMYCVTAVRGTCKAHRYIQLVEQPPVHLPHFPAAQDGPKVSSQRASACHKAVLQPELHFMPGHFPGQPCRGANSQAAMLNCCQRDQPTISTTMQSWNQSYLAGCQRPWSR